MSEVPRMLHGKVPVVIVAVAISAFALWILLIRQGGVNLQRSSLVAEAANPRRMDSSPPESSPRPQIEVETVGIMSSVTTTYERLSSDAPLAEKARILQTLIDSLKSNPQRQQVISGTQDFLQSGRDAVTGLMFSLQPSGHLASAPSIRTALLDLLGELAPDAAAQFDDEIFRGSSIPDEWALALRDQGRQLARNVKEGAIETTREIYSARVTALLNHEEWLKHPTAGFLHAFDAAVFVGDEVMMGRLVAIHKAGYSPATNFAARLAIDRLAINHFAACASVIRSDLRNLSGDLEARASILARADPLNVRDMTLIRDYLLDARVSAEEKNLFLRNFPNGNLEISNNLLTRNPFIPLSSMAARDDAAILLLRDWSNDSNFASLRGMIEERLKRLDEYAALRIGAR